MERRTVLRAAAAVAAPWLMRLRAQTRARRIGVLSPVIDPGGPPPGAAESWKRLGWIEGETLLVQRRYAAWRMERMPEFADELLRRQQVDVLIAYGSEAAAAAARATRTVPIVFWAWLPIECGLIDSYARPGRNCTGFAGGVLEFDDKRAEHTRAIVPSVRRAAALNTDWSQITLSGAALDMQPHYVAAARAHGFELSYYVARRVEDVESALAEAVAAKVPVANIDGPSYIGVSARVVDFALRQRWVTITAWRELFDAGLMVYHGLSGAEIMHALSRIQQTADRILRGANPAEIPVELPGRYELAINLKVARALGITLPQSLLLRADRVVE